jgi:hypothetical protein
VRARERFADDARKSFALAIQEAEKEENGGILRLTVWRAGNTSQVELKLRVMGTYSDTAPYDCPKSTLIFEEACRVFEQEPLDAGIWGAINGLALMATGKPEYLPKVRELARKIGPRTLRIAPHMGSWHLGYCTLLLSEYYLLTGDEEVFPALEQYTIAIAKGQGMYGTFGHGLVPPGPNGELHGSVPPYGPVNATGLVANLAIVMGRKCGVRHPVIDPAIERASNFFGYFVDKGSIPYGEHEPWPHHENNGKNAMAAVFFAVQGNRPRRDTLLRQDVYGCLQGSRVGAHGAGLQLSMGCSRGEYGRSPRRRSLLQRGRLAPRPGAAERWIVYLRRRRAIRSRQDARRYLLRQEQLLWPEPDGHVCTRLLPAAEDSSTSPARTRMKRTGSATRTWPRPLRPATST